MIPHEATDRAADQGRRHDPWAHRRGEPRVFTLMWTVYLLCATAIAIGSVGLHGAVLEEGARAAARTILLTTAAGAVLLWPMTRLSQLVPARRGVGWAVQDTIAILLPMQVVIWPHVWLARWTIGTAAAAACLLVAWSLLVGALLAIALGGRWAGPAVRGCWMVLFVALLAGAPVAELGMRASGIPAGAASGWLAMGSPLTAIDRILAHRAWHGSASLASEHWVGIGLTVVAAGALWLVAMALARGGRRAEALR